MVDEPGPVRVCIYSERKVDLFRLKKLFGVVVGEVRGFVASLRLDRRLSSYSLYGFYLDERLHVSLQSEVQRRSSLIDYQ